MPQNHERDQPLSFLNGSSTMLVSQGPRPSQPVQDATQPGPALLKPVPDAVEWYGGVKSDDELFTPAAPGDQQPAQDPVGNWIWSWLMDWCKTKGLAPATQDSLFAMVKDARSKFEVVSNQISNDKQAQQFIPKALHLEASQISAFLYAGAIECDFDRWDGHVGFVANCAEVALDIAGFLKENAGTENPGVIAYELFEPFGKWMAEEGHLAQNSLLDEFKAQYHAWIKEGQAPIPRESAS